jgi:molybdate transport system substrate-binding protein
MKKYLVMFIFAFLVFSVSFFYQKNQQEELSIAFAASFKNVANELIAEFNKENKFDVKTSVAASGVLSMQIEQNAPYHLFISASTKYTDLLIEKEFIKKENVQTMAFNAISVVVNKNKITYEDTSIDVLLNNAITRIAIGNTEFVPAGIYGKMILEDFGIYEKLENKFVFANNVKQCLLWVEQGEVEAGIVYFTDYLTANNLWELKRISQIRGKKIEYPIALTKRGEKSKLAIDFRDFVLSQKGQNILAKYGFLNKNE